MNIDKLNKKRKNIVILSIAITFLLLTIFFVVEILFASKYFIVFILCIFGLIFGLFSLSKFIVMPLYNKLVIELVKDYLNKTNGVFEFKTGYLKDDLLLVLFNKKNLDVSNRILMQNNDVKIYISDFIYLEKANKNDKIRFTGKSLSFVLNKPVKNYFILDSTNKLSESIQNQIKDNYIKSCELSLGKKYKLFNCYYNDLYSSDLINDIMFLNNFCMIKSHDCRIDIVFFEKEDGFNFKLQEKFNNDINIYCKEKYLNANKVITTVLNNIKENENV